MKQGPDYINNIEAEPSTEVIFDYSAEHEIRRVKYTIGRYKFYKENGYRPKYPKAIQQKLEGKQQISEKDILDGVSSEFEPDKYASFLSAIQENWKGVEEKFFEDLRGLGLPIQNKYHVSATVYGTGGSYDYPDNVQLNLEQRRTPHLTLAHEIVHLTIEPLIRQYDIDHWTKERLVDLIMNKFFPEDKKLQRDPENAEQITEIFERLFPNIEKIILEISKLKETQ